MRGMRQERLRAVLQAEIAQFFFNLRLDMDINELIAVDEVMVTPDLKQANIWISFVPMPSEGRGKVLWTKMQKALPQLKTWLSQRVELRKVPNISLNFSHPEEEYKLDRIFDELDKR